MITKNNFVCDFYTYIFNPYKSPCSKSSNKNAEIVNIFCSLPICRSPNSKLDENRPSSLVLCVMRENLAYVAVPCYQLYCRGEGNIYPHNINMRLWCCCTYNAGFCNGCITNRILLLQAFQSQENQYNADYMTKILIFFSNLIFYQREIVKLDHLWHFPWVMQTPFCDAAIAKSTVL